MVFVQGCYCSVLARAALRKRLFQKLLDALLSHPLVIASRSSPSKICLTPIQENEGNGHHLVLRHELLMSKTKAKGGKNLAECGESVFQSAGYEKTAE
jgi:hypothetical protein